MTEILPAAETTVALLPADPWTRLVASWLAAHAGHTRIAYGRDVVDWARWCAAHEVDPLAVERAHVDLYARDLDENRGAAPATVARRLAALAGLYGYAVDEDLLTRSPVARVRRPKVAPDNPSVGLDRTEARELLRIARADSPRAGALVTLMICNGPRVGEVLGADVVDLTTERGHRVWRHRRKGGRQGTTVIAAAAGRALDLYLSGRTDGPLFVTRSGRRLDEPYVWRLVRRLGRQAELPQADRLSPHSLRHTFVTLALDAGVPLRDVQDSAGHASADTTRTYDRARKQLDRAATYALTAYLDPDGS